MLIAEPSTDRRIGVDQAGRSFAQRCFILASGGRMDLTTIIGLLAALCTTGSYFPQLMKCWTTGSAGDLSLKMFLILTGGIALWIAYGVLKEDIVIMLANGLSLLLLLGILYFKLREMLGTPQTSAR